MFVFLISKWWGFMHSRWYLLTPFFFEKATLIKMAGVRTPWTPPLDPPLSGFRKQQLFSSRQSARAAVSSCTTRSKSSPVTRLTLAAGLDWTEADRWVTIWPRVMAPRVSTEQTACTDDVATAGSRASASAFSSQRMNFPRSVSYTAYNDGRSISTCGSMA